MDDLFTTIGLAILATGIILWLRARDQRQLSQPPASTQSGEVGTDQQTETAASRPAHLVVPTLEPPHIDAPLATSLSVKDVVEPQTQIPSVQYPEPGAGDTAQIPLDEAMPGNGHSDRQTVLEEINHMGETGQGEAIAQISRHVEDPDHLVRTAVASALGELATHLQGPRREEAVAHLHHLSQDASPEVRVEAAAALSRLA